MIFPFLYFRFGRTLKVACYQFVSRDVFLLLITALVRKVQLHHAIFTQQANPTGDTLHTIRSAKALFLDLLGIMLGRRIEPGVQYTAHFKKIMQAPEAPKSNYHAANCSSNHVGLCSPIEVSQSWSYVAP